MKRRDFLSTLAAAPLAASASPIDTAVATTGNDLRLAAADRAWVDAFARTEPAYDCALPMRLPAGLQGTLYRNGPALMSLNGARYHHWLDGDGMIHRFRFGDGRLVQRSQLTATRKLMAELKARRRLAPGFGTSLPGTAVTGPDDTNTANINTLLLNGQLLALWEGGAPTVIDPQSLRTVGKKSWSPATDGLPFSAHPRVDANGEVWSFGYLPGRGLLALYHLDAQGALKQLAFVPAPQADMVHDFAITERYLVFVLMPYRFDVTRNDPTMAFVDHYVWQDCQPSVVLVIDKATLGIVRQLDGPPAGLFHLGNAWEHGNTLRFGIVNYQHFPEVMQRMSDVFDNACVRWPDNRWTEYEVDLASGRVRTSMPCGDSVEFPRYDLRRTGQPSRIVYLLADTRPADQPLFGMNTVRRIDQQTGAVQDYDYGGRCIVEEHVFVPAPGSHDNEHHGWLVGTAYDWKRQRTLVSVFHAAHIADGPIAQTTLPYGLPLGLHGNFYPS